MYQFVLHLSDGFSVLKTPRVELKLKIFMLTDPERCAVIVRAEMVGRYMRITFSRYAS